MTREQLLRTFYIGKKIDCGVIITNIYVFDQTENLYIVIVNLIEDGIRFDKKCEQIRSIIAPLIYIIGYHNFKICFINDNKTIIAHDRFRND